uniref:Ground-like domain-containing protein n=1 Tax=Angiostrongylus cantonensis TaxID=6313 RepID=A0A158PBH4_ANGCA
MRSSLTKNYCFEVTSEFLGFTCCNKQLEAAMKGAMGGKDLLSAADEIQKMAESTLGGKFETVVALDDFAYKSHFKVRTASFYCSGVLLLFRSQFLTNLAI